MTQKYVVTDDQGRAAAFFDNEIHAGQIPDGAVPIADTLWRDWVRDTSGQVLEGAKLRKVQPEDLMSVDELGRHRHRQVNQRRDRAYADGFVWQDNLYDIDREAQVDMIAAYAMLKGGVTSPHGGAWRTRENVMVPMDDATLESFLLAASRHVLEIKRASWAHKDALAQIKSRSGLIAYDIFAAWPVSP